jgi:hypothetical protein
MNSQSPYADIPVIGELPQEELVALLDEMGDTDTAGQIRQTESFSAASPQFEAKGIFEAPAWKYTSHVFGHIGQPEKDQSTLAIQEVGRIEPDTTLSGARINVTLDYLRVADYPGYGTHTVLFDFFGKNQLKTETEPVHFNATYRIRDGQRAPVKGWPIFIGLSVKDQGLALNCSTVNVKSSGDETFLGFLDSDLFKSGLKLATTAQPAIAPFSAMAVALTRRILGSRQNQKVQDFYLGLGLSNESPTGARLRTGSYVVVQVPESDTQTWRWRDWQFDRDSGQISSVTNWGSMIPYNYMIFGITRFRE